MLVRFKQLDHWPVLIILQSFNSMLVRFKHETLRRDPEIQRWFQFYVSAIQTSVEYNDEKKKKTFQFYVSAIQTLPYTNIRNASYPVSILC